MDELTKQFFLSQISMCEQQLGALKSMVLLLAAPNLPRPVNPQNNAAQARRTSDAIDEELGRMFSQIPARPLEDDPYDSASEALDEVSP